MNDFDAALKGEDHEHIPVWFMRQAGRYSKHYQEIRKGKSLKEICMDPEMTYRVTSAPIDELGVDAAILFFDILLPAEGMGFHVDYEEGVGPRVSNPILSEGTSSDIYQFDANSMPYPVGKSIELFRNRKPGYPIIGFSGGPLTILSYLLRGESDRELIETRKLLLNRSRESDIVLDMITETTIETLRLQIRSGCSAVQVFDSWAGYLPPSLLGRYVERYVSQISSEISGKCPSIYFSTQTSAMLPILRNSGFDFLSLDWRCDLGKIAGKDAGETGLQGNLDPLIAATNREMAVDESVRIASEMKYMKRYIFNLGHGVLPQTSPQTLKSIVDSVHSVVID